MSSRIAVDDGLLVGVGARASSVAMKAEPM
jgi:hypothetical protein